MPENGEGRMIVCAHFRLWSAAIPRVRDRFRKRGHVRALQKTQQLEHRK